MESPRKWYPSATEVDGWCRAVFRRAEGADVGGELLDPLPWSAVGGIRHARMRYVAFHSVALGTWYGIWQPCPSGRGPLLVHVPGYAAEMSAHPELTADGYNVLHVNPLGYVTPEGPDLSKRVDDAWPVLPDTVRTLGEALCGVLPWIRGRELSMGMTDDFEPAIAEGATMVRIGRALFGPRMT